jgi:3-dehydrosphinganine reductase
MDRILNSRHAIISGGSSGIGLALARLLVQRGFHVSILGRDPQRLERARKELEKDRISTDQDIALNSVDVTDATKVQAAIDAAILRSGAPEFVIACAGAVTPGHFLRLDPGAFHRDMAVNYFGALHLARAVLPAMRARRRGHLTLISSGAALLGFYGNAAYAPSKFAVRGLAEVLRSEFRPDGIKVSVVYPPDTDTPQLREEIKVRPEPTRRIAGTSGVLDAAFVARTILRGMDSGRFVIAPGWSMKSLALFHSLVGPLLNRLWFDPVVARYHRDETH